MARVAIDPVVRRVVVLFTHARTHAYVRESTHNKATTILYVVDSLSVRSARSRWSSVGRRRRSARPLRIHTLSKGRKNEFFSFLPVNANAELCDKLPQDTDRTG